MKGKIWLLKAADRLIGRIVAKVFPKGRRRDIVNSPKRILFIRPGGIGDAVLTIPVISVLARHFPYAAIEVLAEKRNRDAYSMTSGVQRIFCYDVPQDLLYVLSRRYELVIDTEQWHYLSAIVARMTNAPMRIGFSSNDRERLFTHTVTYDLQRHELASFLDLLIPLQVVEEPGPADMPKVPAAARNKAQELMGGKINDPYVAIFPGASTNEKMWPVERFRALAAILSEAGIPFVVVGGKLEERIGKEVVRGTGGLNVAGLTSLQETAAVLEQAVLYVGGDSGLLHMAAMLGTATVSFFGPSSHVKWAPQGDAHTKLHSRLPCAPCSSFSYTPACTDNWRCISDVSVKDVEEAVFSFLKTDSYKTVVHKYDT